MVGAKYFISKKQKTKNQKKKLYGNSAIIQGRRSKYNRILKLVWGGGRNKINLGGQIKCPTLSDEELP